jgi:hypothetical protein
MDAIFGRAGARRPGLARWGGASLALAGLLLVVLPSSLASASPPPPYTVTVAPASVVAGSTGNTVTFQFTAITPSNIPLMAQVPSGAGRSNPAGAVLAAALQQICNSASMSSATGAGGTWTITGNAKCQLVGHTVTLTYTHVTAPTKAAQYTFTTLALFGIKFSLPSASRPTVTVLPAPATQLTLSGLGNATAGTPQSPTVTLQDKFGNIASGYRGTVHFSANPALNGPGLSPDYTFTASDAGTHTFTNDLILTTAGSQTVTAADTAASTLTGSETITISPGPTTFMEPAFGQPNESALIGQTIGIPLTVTAEDDYGNVTPNFNSPVNVEIAGGAVANDSIALDQGQGTIVVDAAVTSSQLELSASTSTDPSLGITDLLAITAITGIQPDNSVELNVTSINPDGTYTATLDVPGLNLSLVPSSVQINPSQEIFLDGTTSVPITATTAGGDTISATATTTSAVGPSGTIVVENPGSTTPLVVTACINGVQGVPVGDTPPPADMTLPCESGFAPVTVNVPVTPTVSEEGQSTQALFNVTNVQCITPVNTEFDPLNGTCEPAS